MLMLMSTADTLRRLYLVVTSVIVYVCSRLFTSLHIVFRGFIFHPLLFSIHFYQSRLIITCSVFGRKNGTLMAWQVYGFHRHILTDL